MTSYGDALKRLQIIYNDTAADAKEKRNAEKNLDEFTRLKKSIHKDAKEVRQLIKDREELLANKPGSKEVAEASHKIRAKLKALRDDAGNLSRIQRQDEKKVKPGQEADIKNKLEIVSLVQKHIEECENLEKKRFNDKVQSERSALMGGGTSVKIEMTNFGGGKPAPSAGNGTDSQLPDIDNDPEVTSGLQALAAGNQDLDNDLDQISNAVGQLKEVAINMDSELTKQNGMLDELDKKADKTAAHMDNVNLKMKKAVEGMMKGDKFLVNCVLISIILALAGFIGSYFV
eukprot:Partr_v1_DN25113_c0_g1_i2_m76941 putative NA